MLHPACWTRLAYVAQQILASGNTLLFPTFAFIFFYAPGKRGFDSTVREQEGPTRTPRTVLAAVWSVPAGSEAAGSHDPTALHLAYADDAKRVTPKSPRKSDSSARRGRILECSDGVRERLRCFVWRFRAFDALLTVVLRSDTPCTPCIVTCLAL